ncbi:MAG: dihydropteroate synthase, partial [Candidatus Brocadiia bacterium]
MTCFQIFGSAEQTRSALSDFQLVLPSKPTSYGSCAFGIFRDISPSLSLAVESELRNLGANFTSSTSEKCACTVACASVGVFHTLARSPVLAQSGLAASIAAELARFAPKVIWRVRGRHIEIGARPLVMGILNVTPDSFSDAGQFLQRDAAIARALSMIEERADIIDIGGQSSRPGAVPISEQEEEERVLPVLSEIRGKCSIPISVDTFYASSAARYLDAGAEIVNDISAMRHPSEMARVISASGAGVILMHMRGEPRTMQSDPTYADVVQEVRTFLDERITCAESAGIPLECIAVDPGIGFGKMLEHNLQIVRSLGGFAARGRPVVLGHSRKGFIGMLSGRPIADRD